MDKKVLDTLIKFGLVTNICVDSEKYKDTDDLINKGIITIPGAKTTIERILKDLNKTETVIEETAIGTEPVIEETAIEAEPVIEETAIEAEPVIEETAIEAEPVIEETAQKKRKSKKAE